MKNYYVYIMTNRSGTLYIGVTNNLEKRVYEHKSGQMPGFSKSYKTDRLVYFEANSDVIAAITREKQLKGWLRDKKLGLIKSLNPCFEDLSRKWNENLDPSAKAPQDDKASLRSE